MDQLKEFEKELLALLKKYKATISFNCAECSDTYGIYDARLEASIGKEEIRLTDGWFI